MSNLYATVTIDSKVEDDFKILISKLEATCHDVVRKTVKDKDTTKFMLDIGEECLAKIRTEFPTMSITSTPYITSSMGLKVMDSGFGDLTL